MGTHRVPDSCGRGWCHNGITMTAYLSTRDVCQGVGLSEPALRHVLRRPGAPRPQIHPSARVFLWTHEDLNALRRFLSADQQPEREEAQGER